MKPLVRPRWYRLLSAVLVAALVNPSPAAALRPVRAGAEEIAAGLEENPPGAPDLPNLALPTQEPHIPGTPPFEPHRSLHPAIEAAKLSHRRAIGALQAATTRPPPVEAAPRPSGQPEAFTKAVGMFKGAVANWATAASEIQRLSHVAEPARSARWTSQTDLKGYAAALTAAGQYVADATAAAERGLAYAKAQVPQVEIAAPAEPSEFPGVASPADLPAPDLTGEIPPPVSEAPPAADILARLQMTGALASTRDTRSWGNDREREFVTAIHQALRDLAVASEPLLVVQRLVMADQFTRGQTPESVPSALPPLQAAHWTLEQLSVVAADTDYWDAQAANHEGREPDFFTALSPRWSETVAWARTWPQRHVEGRGAELPDYLGEHARNDLNQTITTLVAALRQREFTDPPPAAAGLEEEFDLADAVLIGQPVEGLPPAKAGAVVTALQRYADTAEWSWGQQFPYRVDENRLWVFSEDHWIVQAQPRVAAGEAREDAVLQVVAKDLSAVVAGWLRPGGSQPSRAAHVEEDFMQITVAPVMPQTVLERITRRDPEGLRRYRIVIDPTPPPRGGSRPLRARRLRFLVEETYLDALPPLPTEAGLEERTFGTVFDYALLAQSDALWRTPAQWRAWLDSPGGAAYLHQLYGDDAALVDGRRAAYRRVLAQYEQDYGTTDPVAIFRASGRVHWLGVHIDRPGAEAPVNRFGINGRELIMVAGRQPESDLRVQLRSTPENPFGATPYRLDFDVQTQVFDRFPDAPIKLTDSTATEPTSWNQTAYRMNETIRADGKTPVEFVAGVAYLLHHGVPGGLTRGFRAAMEGNIPPALGMSTSSALTIAVSQAFTAANQIELVEKDPAPSRRQMTFADWLVRTGYAEWIVRTRGGNADHRSILFSRPGFVSHLGKTEVLARMQLPASLAAVVLNTPARKDDDDDTSATRVAAYQRGLRFLRRAFIGHETLGAIVESGATPVAIATAIRDQIPEDDSEARATTLAQLADIARSFAMRRLLEDRSLPDGVKIARLFQMTKAYQEQQRTTDYPGDPAPWNEAVVSKTGITNAALDAWIARLQAGNLRDDSPDLLENLATIGAYGVSVANVDNMVRALRSELGDDWTHVAPIMQGVGFGGTVLTFVDTSKPELLDRVMRFYQAYANQYFPAAYMEPIVVTPGRGAEALVPPTAAGMEERRPFAASLSPSLTVVLTTLHPGPAARFTALQWTAWAVWQRLVRNRTQPLTVAVVVPAYAGDIPRIERQDAFFWKLRELQALTTLDAKGLVRFIVYVVDDKAAPGLQAVVEDAVERAVADSARIAVQYLRLADLPNRVPGLPSAEESRKWGAVRAGMAVAIAEGKADIIAMSDSDTNQRLTELPNLLAPILEDGAAVAIGSRFMPGAATTAMGIHNYAELFLYNPFVSLAMPELGSIPIRDVQSGVKAFAAEALREPLQNMRDAGFAADAELLWLIARAGGRILETPRSEIEESLGDSTIALTRYPDFARHVQNQVARHERLALNDAAQQLMTQIDQVSSSVDVVAQQPRLAGALDAIQSGERSFEQAAASVRDVFAPPAGLEEKSKTGKTIVMPWTLGTETPLPSVGIKRIIDVGGHMLSLRDQRPDGVDYVMVASQGISLGQQLDALKVGKDDVVVIAQKRLREIRPWRRGQSNPPVVIGLSDKAFSSSWSGPSGPGVETLALLVKAARDVGGILPVRWYWYSGEGFNIETFA